MYQQVIEVEGPKPVFNKHSFSDRLSEVDFFTSLLSLILFIGRVLLLLIAFAQKLFECLPFFLYQVEKTLLEVTFEHLRNQGEVLLLEELFENVLPWLFQGFAFVCGRVGVIALVID